MSLSRPLENLQKPQWFIRVKGSRMQVNETVLNDLQGLGSHVIVVSIVGSLRTGKSWILSQLAGCNARNGFEVAEGQTAVTSGIWILCRKHPHKENCVIVFLDTEGLHDPYKQDTTNDDNRHFILAFLISDIFILNVMHKFDSNDLEKVGFIAMISKQLQKTDAQKTFPEFHLLLRDVPQIKIRGQAMTPNEYLEDVLKQSEDENDRFSSKSSIREYCQRRYCWTLTQPVDFEKLDELGEMDHPTLKDKFVDGFTKISNHILKNTDVKRFITGAPYTTQALCSYTVALVEDVDNDVIPKVASVQERVAETENKRLLDETTNTFKVAMRNEEKSYLYESLNERYKALQREAIEKLQDHLIPMSPQHKENLIDLFKEFTEDEYLKVSGEKSRDLLTGLLEPYFLMVKDNAYKAPDARQAFEKDVQKVKENYDKQQKCIGPERDKIWEEMQKPIQLRTTELELIDMRHRLLIVDTANKVERERLEQMVNKLESDKKEQKLELERNVRAAKQTFELQNRQIESQNNARVVSSTIDGIARIGAAAMNILR